jgi:hydrogenase maturation protease
VGHILVIGYGNTLRRDDGAGVALAERLAALWQGQAPVRLLTVTQLTPELAIDIAATDVGAVVFVDATVGALHEQIQVKGVAGDGGSPVLGHHLDPAVLMMIARLLNERNLPGWLVTVPGIDFNHGEGLSPPVQRLLSTAAAVANRLLAEMDACRASPVILDAPRRPGAPVRIEERFDA